MINIMKSIKNHIFNNIWREREREREDQNGGNDQIYNSHRG